LRVRILAVATFFAVGVVPADPDEAAVVLVELNVVEQRYQAVLEVLNDGATVTDVAVGSGWLVRRCTSGCAGMRPRGWVGWPTTARGRGRVRIR
jgi:hypothetical protein